MVSLIKVDKLDPQSGTALEIGTSGDTITIPSGATIVNSGTATGFGGGKVLQVFGTNFSAQGSSTTSASYVDTNMTAAITPSATSSKILVLASFCGVYSSDSTGVAVALNGSTNGVLYEGSPYSAYRGGSDMQAGISAIMYLDSPSVTSAETYKISFKCRTGGTAWFGHDGGSNSDFYLTLIEIGT